MTRLVCRSLSAILLAGVMLAGAGPSLFGQLIPKTGWTVKSVDSQETVGENGAATNTFDGSPSTKWVTRWSGSVAPMPHDIQIDMGQYYDLDSFRYLPRQDGCSNGWIDDFEFYTSIDGANWTKVAEGAFDYQGAAFICPGAAQVPERIIGFSPITARFFRLKALSEVRGFDPTAVAELSVTGGPPTSNIPPDSTITGPAGNITISAGQTVNFTGTGSDPNNNTPLTYAWNFGGAPGVDSTEQNPSFQFNAPGQFVITFTVTDSLGLADPTPATRTITVLAGGGNLLPKTGWTLKFVSSQETSGENGAATNGFDSNNSSKWVTKWSGGVAPMPHEIQIDMGQYYDLDGFRYLPRQDNCANGWIKDYAFDVSSDGTNWTPVAQGTFDYEGAAFVCPGAAQISDRIVSFTATTARFFRLRALSEVRNNAFATMAEISVTGGPPSGNQPPNGSITSPSSSVTISVGESVSFTGSGADPDNNTPLTYAWNFGGGAPNSSEQSPTVQFNTPGTFTAALTVTDSLGLADPTPATRSVTVLGAGSNVLPRTGWTLKFVDSQETSGENGAAVNSFDGNNTTKWVTKWSGTVAPMPHEIQIDMNQLYDLDGFRYLPRQDGCANGWIANYAFDVSEDGTNWTPVAQGAFDYQGASIACPGAPQISERAIAFAAIRARYFRLRALSEVHGYPFATAAEINVTGGPPSGNLPPDSTITSP
ncbi:MAG: discoidin domain-containing protein, partial [Candidatus Korobacteraceae bacterium]